MCEANEVHLVSFRRVRPPQTEVLRLDVAEDDLLRVNVADNLENLHGNVRRSAEAKAAAAGVENSLQTGAKQLEDEDVVGLALAKIKHLWQAWCRS